jgi:xanthosine utilization system XapX-like protein
MSEHALPDPDAEREVDLRSAWSRITARWWLPVAGLLVGAVLGVLASVGGGDVFRARTLLYLGQPFTTSGGGQIQSLATNPKTVSQIIRSEAALRRAAAASGLTLGQLRGNVTSQAVVSAGQARNVSPLVEITVNASAANKAEKAANSLAGSVVGVVSTYVDEKIQLLNKQIVSSRSELADIDQRVSSAVAQQQAVIADKTMSSTDKLIVIGSLNNTISFSEQRRGTVQQELFQNQQLLSLAENVEKSKVVQEAVASRTTATSRRNAAAIGGLLGLLVGALAAALADPLLQRRNARSKE